MGDPVLDKLFNGFGFVFGPAIIGFMLFCLCSVSWVLAGFFQNFYRAFQLANQEPLVIETDAAAREVVLHMRELQDAARRNRILRRRQLASVNQDEVLDKMMELTRAKNPPTYLICKNPLGEQPTYFVNFLKGTAIGAGAKGIRDAKFLFSPIRSLAKSLNLDDAQKMVAALPDHKKLFIVPIEGSLELDKTIAQFTVPAEANVELDITDELMRGV